MKNYNKFIFWGQKIKIIYSVLSEPNFDLKQKYLGITAIHFLKLSFKEIILPRC